jgi:SAM-dependent methyltransferase
MSQREPDPFEQLIERLRPENDDPLFDLLTAEARFGWREIRDHVPEGTTALEVGAGPGILAAALAGECQSVTALEPVADGFSTTTRLLGYFESEGPDNLFIRRERLEDHDAPGGYDFIWSVNVFEHLEDWRAGLTAVSNLLRPGGEALILCPNYAVPYESHFNLPILINKPTTRRLFAKSISRFEREGECSGLWDSLNMITSGEVRAFGCQTGIKVTFDRDMTTRILDRFATDSSLRDRHRWAGGLIGFVHALGIHRLWRQLPMMFHPYMAIRVSRPD